MAVLWSPSAMRAAPLPNDEKGRHGTNPWSSHQWCAYFRANREALLKLPWERGAELTESERETIACSLQDFQLGESSEGHHLLERARRYAARTGDQAYAEAIELFIREEQRHAGDLGRFLQLAGIPLATGTWLDSLFRRLRRLAGLGLCLCVLLTAETIGMVYYLALRRSTGAALLRRVCGENFCAGGRPPRFFCQPPAPVRPPPAR